jgi:hypothetical protein
MFQSRAGLTQKFQELTNQARTAQGLSIVAASAVVKGEITDEPNQYRYEAETDNRKHTE